MSNENKKLTLIPLVLIIFTSVFGFANMPRSFYLMGYGAIPWFIVAAILFFIPFALMVAEYGAAYKDSKGGIYSWMESSVGPRYAFVGTFMWYSSYIIWMVNICSTIWVPFSNLIYGSDETSNWTFFGLNSNKVLGLLGVILIIVITYVSSKGVSKITKVTSIGGTAVALLNILLLVGAIIILIGNGGDIKEEIIGLSSFTTSPNPSYQNIISVLSFLVFAIFSFGGIEALGGFVDKTENAEKTFPKGIILAAIVISVGYSIGIFFCGTFTNWSEVLGDTSVNMANVAYVLMKNLGYQLGISLGLSTSIAITIGNIIARIVGLSMFLALLGAFFTLAYSPLKQLIEGTPKKLWPKGLAEIEDGMPKKAMKVQCIIVVVFILVVSFGGEGASEFFNKLVLMTNVAMTLPYVFISAAFISFKKKDIKRPYEVYKSKGITILFTVLVTAIVVFANFFTIIEPAINGNISSTIWMIAGPTIFTVAALALYSRYEKIK